MEQEPAGPTAPPAVVAWEPEAPGPVSIRALLAEVFTRYAADPWRLYLVALAPAVITVAAGSETWLALTGSLATLLSWAVIMALVDAGPHGVSLATAVRRGGSRVGWLLLTLFVAGVLVGLAAALPFFIATTLLLASPVVGLVALLAVVAVVYWAIGRLALAVPAVVVDRAGPFDAMGRAFHVTRPIGLLGRMLAIYLLCSILTGAPAGAAGLVALTDVPVVARVVAFGLAIAFVIPITPIALLVLYRRYVALADVIDAGRSVSLPPLVVPAIEEAAPSMAIAPAEPPVEPPIEPPSSARSAAATWTGERPATTRGARGLAGAAAAVGLASIVIAGAALGSIRADAVPVGAVPPGQVQFGTDDVLALCSVPHPVATFGRGAPVAWIARYQRPTTATDVVRLRVLRDGSLLIDNTQRSQAAACIGSNGPETGVTSGTYDFTIFVNGEVSAHGAFTLLP